MLLYVAGVYYFRIISKISLDTIWYLLLRMIITEGGKRLKITIMILPFFQPVLSLFCESVGQMPKRQWILPRCGHDCRLSVDAEIIRD